MAPPPWVALSLPHPLPLDPAVPTPHIWDPDRAGCQMYHLPNGRMYDIEKLFSRCQAFPGSCVGATVNLPNGLEHGCVSWV